MTIRIDSTQKLTGLINSSENLLVYFFSDYCAPCRNLRPKVEKLIQDRFPLMDLVFINAEAKPDIAAKFQVFSYPVLVFFFEGKEYLRYSKYVSISELSDSIGRIYDLYHHSS
jgi:thioredoxin-like negative regulator of GroEL